MRRIQKERIKLGMLIDTCSQCIVVPHIAKGTYDVNYCKTECQHWRKLQNQRRIVEALQLEVRIKKRYEDLPY
jgi:hypothetical protein